MSGPNVTMIDQLPELSDVENGGMGGMPGMGGGMGRGRPGMGMGMYQPSMSQIPPEQAQKYARLIRNPPHRPDPQSGMNMSDYQHHDPQQDQIIEQPPMLRENLALTRISCLDISDHVKDCPICSKFYSNDRTVYIIIIVILSVICLLLLKKVLDV